MNTTVLRLPSVLRSLPPIGILLLCACAVLMCQTVVTSAASYCIEGTVSYELQRPQGQAIPNVRSFQLLFDDCRWKITVQDKSTSVVDYYVCQYDGGGDLLCYVKPRGESNTISGSIERCEVPPIWISCAAEYAWLAFASACYFEHSTNGRAISLESLQSPSGQYRRFDVPVNVELSTSEPHLPMQIRYVTDKIRVLKDNGTLQETALPAPLTDGYTGVEFRAGELTNVSGLSFPVGFTLDINRQLPQAKTVADVFCILKVRGTVTNIAVGPQSIDFGVPIGTAPIMDLRVSNQTALLKTTNGEVPSADSPQAVMARESRARQLIAAGKAQASSAKRIKRTRVLVSILATISVLPLVFFIWKKRQHR